MSSAIPTSEEAIFDQRIQSLEKALESAEVQYSFLGGRKFVLKFADGNKIFSYNQIVKEICTIFEKAFDVVSDLKTHDNESFKEMAHTLKKLKKLPNMAKQLDQKAESALTTDSSRKDLTFKDKLILFSLRIHRFFGSLFFNRSGHYDVINHNSPLLSRFFANAIDIAICERNLRNADAKWDENEAALQFNYKQMHHLRTRAFEPLKSDSGTRMIIDEKGVIQEIQPFTNETAEEAAARQKVLEDAWRKETGNINAKTQAIFEEIAEQIRALKDLKRQFLKEESESTPQTQVSKTEKERFQGEIKGLPSNSKLDPLVAAIIQTLEKLDSIEKDAPPDKNVQLRQAKRSFFNLPSTCSHAEEKKVIQANIRTAHPDRNRGCEVLAAKVFNYVSEWKDGI